MDVHLAQVWSTELHRETAGYTPASQVTASTVKKIAMDPVGDWGIVGKLGSYFDINDLFASNLIALISRQGASDCCCYAGIQAAGWLVGWLLVCCWLAAGWLPHCAVLGI